MRSHCYATHSLDFSAEVFAKKSLEYMEASLPKENSVSEAITLLQNEYETAKPKVRSKASPFFVGKKSGRSASYMRGAHIQTLQLLFSLLKNALTGRLNNKLSTVMEFKNVPDPCVQEH